MNKAVAIPYVIALILGLIAIVILAYWFISQSGKTTNVGTGAECQAKLFSYCVQWQVKDGSDGPQFDWGKCTPVVNSKPKCKE